MDEFMGGCVDEKPGFRMIGGILFCDGQVEQLWCSGRYLFHEARFCQRLRLRPPAIGIAATLMRGRQLYIAFLP